MKLLTVVLHPTDQRANEVREVLGAEFPNLDKIEFREDVNVFIPRAVRLIGARSKHELGAINTSLLRHFDSKTAHN